MPHNLGKSPFHLTVALSVENVIYKDFNLFYQVRGKDGRDEIYFGEASRKIAIEQLKRLLDDGYLEQHCWGRVSPDTILKFLQKTFIDVAWVKPDWQIKQFFGTDNAWD